MGNAISLLTFTGVVCAMATQIGYCETGDAPMPISEAGKPQTAPAAIETSDDTESYRIFPDDVKTIGVVSCSKIVPRPPFVKATNELSKAGYKFKVMSNVLGPQVSEAKRARLFEEAWLDPEIDVLLFSRGGTGAKDVVGLIDWEKLRTRNDMRVIGFSDVTCIVNAMLKKGVGKPMTGPMLSTIGSYASKESRLRMRATLEGKPLPVKLAAIKGGPAVVGRPMGGLISRLVALQELDFLPSAEGRIVFLENTAGASKNAPEYFDALVNAGFFEKAAAVVFCSFNDKDPPEATTALLNDFAKRVPCPVFRGYPYGHVPDSFLVDFSLEMRIAPDPKSEGDYWISAASAK